MHDSELIRHYTLDRARIMFVTDLIKDMLTSLTPLRNAIVPEMDVITTWTTLTYLATGKMQLCSRDDLGLIQHLLCHCSFPIKYIIYDTVMVKKKVNNKITKKKK